MHHPLLAPLLTIALPYDPAAHVTQQRLALVAALSVVAVVTDVVRSPAEDLFR